MASSLGLQLRRPDLIDPALLRPGRLDVLLYVGVAEDSNSKLKVLQALTRKFVMEDEIDLGIVAEKCPPTFTGADMYALSSDAWMTALKRTVAQVRPSLCFKCPPALLVGLDFPGHEGYVADTGVIMF